MAIASDGYLLAAWLKQIELKDEARKYSRGLAAERPEDSNMKGPAAQ